MRSAPTRGLLICALLCSRQLGALAQDAGEPDTFIDKLEYKVEIDRHERLAATRKAAGVTLAPFVSDGCSGGQSAGWALASSAVRFFAERHGSHPPWESCCTEHDRIYHAGGPPDADAKTSFEARRLADEQLRACVRRVGEERTQVLMTEYGLGRDEVTLLYRGIADAMYRAVRLGGAPCTRLPWRWGFGWPTASRRVSWMETRRGHWQKRTLFGGQSYLLKLAGDRRKSAKLASMFLVVWREACAGPRAAMTIVDDNAAYETWLSDWCDVVQTDLDYKHDRMKQSPFVFLRATFFRWAKVIPISLNELAAAPTALSVGDAHVENFGTWIDAAGNEIWGVNDFDDAANIPYPFDLVRLATSAMLARRRPPRSCRYRLRSWKDTRQALRRLVLLWSPKRPTGCRPSSSRRMETNISGRAYSRKSRPRRRPEMFSRCCSQRCQPGLRGQVFPCAARAAAAWAAHRISSLPR